MPKKPAVASDNLVVFDDQSTWLEYQRTEAPDAPPIRVKVRTCLTFEEAETLYNFEEDTPTSEIWQRLAPWVLEWNIATRGANGQPVAVEAPAVGGGEVFSRVPNGLFRVLFFDVRRVNRGGIDPKLRTLPGSTESEPSSTGSSSAKNESTT